MLFLIAMILLVHGMAKYQLLTVIVVAWIYASLPQLLITAYQETFAEGVTAISYDGNGHCNFEYIREDVLNGECSLALQNRSNEAVTFELEFLDSFPTEDGIRMESLMNVAGPYKITIEANHEKSMRFKELLELSGVPKHFDGGTSSGIHLKLIDGENMRTL